MSCSFADRHDADIHLKRNGVGFAGIRFSAGQFLRQPCQAVALFLQKHDDLGRLERQPGRLHTPAQQRQEFHAEGRGPQLQGLAFHLATGRLHIFQGDFGTSVTTRQPILTDIKVFLPATLELVLAGMLIAIVIGIPGVGSFAVKSRFTTMSWCRPVVGNIDCHATVAPTVFVALAERLGLSAMMDLGL